MFCNDFLQASSSLTNLIPNSFLQASILLKPVLSGYSNGTLIQKVIIEPKEEGQVFTILERQPSALLLCYMQAMLEGRAGENFLSFPLNFQSAFQIVMQTRRKTSRSSPSISYISQSFVSIQRLSVFTSRSCAHTRHGSMLAPCSMCLVRGIPHTKQDRCCVDPKANLHYLAMYQSFPCICLLSSHQVPYQITQYVVVTCILIYDT